MHNGKRSVAWSVALVTVLGLALLSQGAQAQKFQVLHYFTGGVDGGNPKAGLTMDAAGNFYGTTYAGGTGYGVVYKLKHSGASWTVAPLYTFSGGADGANPYGRVTIAQDGTLYGTAYTGGSSYCSQGCGTVFGLTPGLVAPKNALAPWTQTVIFGFTGVYNGAGPQGDLTFDSSGNIYGTTVAGGNLNGGAVYQLSPSGDGWIETELYSPAYKPYGGVALDGAGKVYGTSFVGYGGDTGAVYRLTHTAQGWTTQSLHQFYGSGEEAPVGGVILDPSGNLYGTTTGGASGYGSVFEITSPGGDNWSFQTLYTFSAGSTYGGPYDKLVMDLAGNLYGTTFYDGAYGYGSVFKLTPANGGWTYTSLHDFTANDGAWPISTVTFDRNGNLYGTASVGGAYNAGVVWEITP